MLVVFNVSRKIGDKRYPKSRRPVEIADSVFEKDWFAKACLEAGDISPAVVKSASSGKAAPAAPGSVTPSDAKASPAAKAK